MKSWVVVADRVQARVFARHPFELLHVLNNPLGREKNRSLTTDKPGWARSRFSSPASTHALTGEKNQHEIAALQFAREIARFLEAKLIARRFDELLIVAEPKMLGRIRQMLPKVLVKQAQWLKKDFGKLSAHQIGQSLAQPSIEK